MYGRVVVSCLFFFFYDPATTEIYTLSLHDALPISREALRIAKEQRGALVRGEAPREAQRQCFGVQQMRRRGHLRAALDRKSTRLNSSHMSISYAVFCLKKKIIYITKYTTCIKKVCT